MSRVWLTAPQAQVVLQVDDFVYSDPRARLAVKAFFVAPEDPATSTHLFGRQLLVVDRHTMQRKVRGRTWERLHPSDCAHRPPCGAAGIRWLLARGAGGGRQRAAGRPRALGAERASVATAGALPWRGASCVGDATAAAAASDFAVPSPSRLWHHS